MIDHGLTSARLAVDAGFQWRAFLRRMHGPFAEPEAYLDPEHGNRALALRASVEDDVPVEERPEKLGSSQAL